jgi:large subunit ribosomal protein L10
MAMRATRVQPTKVAAIGELKAIIVANADFVFAEYRGLTVEQISILRRQLRAKKAEFHVVKNNFARIAFDELGFPKAVEPVLEGPTGVAFIKDDSNEVAKIMLDFAKETPALKVKGGLIDRGFMNDVQIVAFSRLPGKKLLIAMLMSAMNGPMQKLAYALNAVPTKLVRVLKAIEEQKAAQEQAAPQV